MSTESGPRLTSVSADLLEPDTWHRRAAVYAISAALAGALLWSWLTNVIEVSSGMGQVVPGNRLQVVQSSDDGVVTAILGRRGDQVRQGQVIVRLDPTVASASFNEARVQLAGLAAASARLRAQINLIAQDGDAEADAPVRFSPDGANLIPAAATPSLASRQELYRTWLAAEPQFPAELQTGQQDLVTQNISQFRTGLQELVKSLSSFDQQIAQRQQEQDETRARMESAETALGFAQEQLATVEKLLKSGAASKGEVIAARARESELAGTVSQLKIAVPRFDTQIAELEDRRAERLNSFRSRSAEMLTEAETKQAAIAASIGALALRAERTEVRAPASGTLKTLQVASLGQVVKTGEIIAEIVPSEGGLLVQAKVRPEDIAFLKPGMPAIIRLTAYDYSIFGSLSGTLERIASDSTTDDKGNVYYLADVRTSQDYVERRGERWPIVAGMVANVDIVTGKRSIFQYVTKPIHRMAASALRER